MTNEMRQQFILNYIAIGHACFHAIPFGLYMAFALPSLTLCFLSNVHQRPNLILAGETAAKSEAEKAKEKKKKP